MSGFLGGDGVLLHAGVTQQVDEADHLTHVGLLVTLNDPLEIWIFVV